MLLKHSGGYLLARILPAAVSFASLVLYTRLLSPADYGIYVLVIAGVSLVKALMFSWLDMALLRIMPAHKERPEALLGTVLAIYLLLVVASGIAGVAAAALWPDPVIAKLIAFGVPLLWAHAWFELNLTLAQAKLMPGRYGLMMCARALVTLGLGATLILWGAGAYAPLIGFCAGSMLGGVAIAAWDWRGIRPRIDGPLSRQLAHYGVPLTGTIALAFVLDAADRFMISAMIGEEAVGPYAAAYDLTAQSLTMLMMIVNLAAYPLAVRAYEEGGMAKADDQIRQNGAMLMAVALPATTGIVILAGSIAGVFLGPAFRDTGAQILPWIAVAMLLAGMREYFFDLAFQLKRRTGLLIWSPAVAAVCNILLNLWWIPKYGVVGAAWATLTSYLIALLVCIVIGRQLLPIRPDWSQLARIAAATSAMGGVLLLLPQVGGVIGMIEEIAAGAAVYAAGAVLLDVMGARTYLLRRLGIARPGICG
jgi:O-antigen/teichoic acid export membrane protein